MKRLFAPLLAALLALSLQAEERPTAKPNILFVISDDMGYSDLACYGGEIETPNLDALAAKGLRFTNYYVNNMCWPTRASLMTSLYPKSALPSSGGADDGLHPEAIALPEALRQAGYGTYMSGKWHLSDAAQSDGPNAPHHRGFDHYYGTIHGTSDFFAPADLQLDGQSMEHEWKDNPNFYYTDAITDYALKFLKERDSGPANREKPFFLYVAYNAAHWPLHAKPEDIAHYKGRYAMGWDALRQQRHERMKALGIVDPDWTLSPRHPDVPSWEAEEHKTWQERRMEVYAAQITSMDRNIGRMVDYLKQTGEYDNTLIVYQQDNGGCHVEYPPTRTGSWTKPFTTDGKKRPVRPGNLPEIMPGDQSSWQSYGHGWANASNTPFRLFKQHDHEGGTRSPLIMSWPKGIARQQAGGLDRTVSHVVDMMPTLLEAAGAKPKTRKDLPLEGRSFLSALTNPGKTIAEHEAIYWEHSQGRAIRSGEWKLVSIKGKPWELYHLSEDGTELNDLAAQMPEKVAQLEALHSEWDRRTNLGKKKKK